MITPPKNVKWRHHHVSDFHIQDDIRGDIGLTFCRIDGCLPFICLPRNISLSIIGQCGLVKIYNALQACENLQQMCALINEWERWEPDGDLKKGKEILSTNWRIVEMNKKAKGRRKGGEDNNDDGSNDNDGYHLDKYNDVEELPFRLDNGNLRKVTGLDCEIAEEEECEKGDENNDEEDGAGENGNDEDTMRWVRRMKKSGKGVPIDIRIGEDEKNMVGVWSSLLGNIVINVRTSQSQINFNSSSKIMYKT
jgi:hypothetical protein